MPDTCHPPHLPMPQELFVGADASAFAAAAAVGLNAADESLPYSTSELNAPEYSTDNFRMFQFKVRMLPVQRRRCVEGAAAHRRQNRVLPSRDCLLCRSSVVPACRCSHAAAKQRRDGRSDTPPAV